jgi:TolB protein
MVRQTRGVVGGMTARWLVVAASASMAAMVGCDTRAAWTRHNPDAGLLAQTYASTPAEGATTAATAATRSDATGEAMAKTTGTQPFNATGHLAGNASALSALAAAMEGAGSGAGERGATASRPKLSWPISGNASSVETGSGEFGESPEGLTQISFGSVGADFDPSVSRDGQWLVFSSTQHRATADLYVAKVGSRAVTQLTSDPANDAMPVLSPDNKRVAFASDRGGSWQIYVMPATGGRAVQITDGGGEALHPTWSSDGSRIAFCRLGEVSGRWELWVVEAANPAKAEFIGYGLFPEFAPVAAGEGNAERLVFQRGRERGDRAFGLWTVDYKPGMVSNPTEVLSMAGAAAINPSWSPDGQFIAFTQTPIGGGDGAARGEIWIVASDGSAKVSVTGGGAAAGRLASAAPAWGRDGRLYFVSNRGGHEQVWAMSSDRAVAAMPSRINRAPALASTPEAATSNDSTMTEMPAEAPTASVPTP